MQFEEALKAMREGKRVNIGGYIDWWYAVGDDGCVHYYEGGHETGDVEFSLETALIDGIELMSDDWEIVTGGDTAEKEG